MGHAYTPGLKVTDKILITKKRILPLKGDVLVKVGDKVKPDTVVARTLLPGNVEPFNVANVLGIPPEDIMYHMLRKEGERVKQGEVIAKSKSFFGLFSSECKSKAEGTVESISSVTGQVLIRGNPIPVEIKAYLEGEVVEVYEKEGVAVSTWGSFIQGIFGIGGEIHGEIGVVTKDNTEILTDKLIDKNCKDKVVVGGSLVTADAIKKAISVGAKGIVVGGFSDKDLRDFLGYDLGVAITGSEELGITLVITEGFGQINMAEKTFNLLKSKEGQMACINGATQIRAGVIRPEVVVPVREDVHKKEKKEEFENIGLTVGYPIRVIREPYFGRLGKVSALPPALQKLESESSARVLEVEFEDGTKAIIPRANVEMLEE
jgi:transcription antitermination factor NusG